MLADGPFLYCLPPPCLHTHAHTVDPADHTISNQLMSVIWSFGQVFPDYNHNPGSGIEAMTVQNTRFYQPDEIKYHGSVNRGATSINFFDIDSNTNERCRGEFSTGCDAQGQSCDYRATWEVKKFFVEFTVTARQVQSGRTEWAAIGFSDNRMMVCQFIIVAHYMANYPTCHIHGVALSVGCSVYYST